MKRPQSIARAQGKLGVLLPGLGAVSTTAVAGGPPREEGTRQADWLVDPTGHDSIGQADRQPGSAD